MKNTENIQNLIYCQNLTFKKTPYPDVDSIMSFFPLSFFFQVLFVNGRVDQVSNNVSASLLQSNLLLGMNGAQYLAGQIDEVQLYIT